MDQPVARAAKGGQVLGIVAASLFPRFDVMHFQELRMLTSRCTATVPIAGQDFSARSRRDRGCVSFSLFIHLAVALGSFHNVFTDRNSTLAGRDRGFAAIRALMEVDLEWGA